ncbi:diguanylate cyclase [Dickeya sp. CFBP 2040]|uniref:sensor domain-containing diguanylate cyclase n=1 Tax=Dickeya sp. CFBP 2040 TaxID=2718531 RepID=UPI001446AE57|nr:diguanylate cyclase [Dickeya sp. CFBP 2040]NKI75165.1 diguanylate cyclase [Dickeya sp. CFBP 2040]
MSGLFRWLNAFWSRKHRQQTIPAIEGAGQIVSACSSLLMNAPTQAAIISTDPDNQITLFNSGAERLFGFLASEVLGCDASTVVLRQGEMGQLSPQELLRDNRQFSAWCYRKKNGETFWGELSFHEVRLPEGTLLGYLSIITDITERKRLLEQLQQQQKMMNLLLQRVPAVLYTFLIRDDELRFVYCSPVSDRVLGLTPQEMTALPFGPGHPLQDMILQEDLEHIVDHYASDDGRHHSWRSDFRIRTENGEIRWIHAEAVTPYPEDDGIVFYGSMLDITDLKQSETLLQVLAQTDFLTGIANRRYVDERYQQLWLQHEPTRQPLSLLMIDIDRFKRFNDSYGHSQGDACIKSVVKTLADQLPSPECLLGRYGGEEFIVVLPQTDYQLALSLAERCRQAVESMAIPHSASSQGVVTVSIGVAVARPGRDGCSITQLSNDADQALYRAKHLGRNRVEGAGEPEPEGCASLITAHPQAL